MMSRFSFRSLLSLLFLVAIFVTLFLAISGYFSPGDHSGESAALDREKGGNRDNLLLKPVPITDAGGWIGGKAGTILVPADWQVQAGIEWYYHPTMPGRIVLHAVSPDGRDRIDIYPQKTYFMGPTVVPMQPGQSQYYGNTYLQPAGSAGAMMDRIILPWLHPDDRYEVIDRKSLPEYARAVQEMNSGGGASSQADAQRVRIRYQEDGHLRVQDVIGVYAAQAAGPVVFWQAQFIMTITSDEAHIDEAERVHAAMIDSLKIDPQWFNKFLQISEAFQQLVYMNQQLAANQSRIISQLSDYMTENRRQVYENTQRSFDRANRNFSQYIRGVETWENQHGETMELPTGYARGWQSDDGTVLISDNPNLNPNVNPTFKNKNWHHMNKKQG